MIEKKEEVLFQTLSYLSDKGLKFTMADLAKSLGMSKKTIYSFFETKEALLNDVVDYAFRSIKLKEKDILARDDLSLIDKVRSLVIALPDKFDSLNWGRIEGLSEKYPKVYKKIKRNLESDWGDTIRLLEEGKNLGLFTDFQVIVFKTMTESCIEKFLSSSVLEENGMSYVEGLDGMINILLEGIVVR